MRFKYLLYILEQRCFVNEVFIPGRGNIFFKYIFFFSLFWLIVSLFFRKNLYFKKAKILFIILLPGIIFAISPFTLSSFHVSYLAMLTPYLQIIVALGLIEFSRCFKERILKKISITLVCFTILALAGSNLKAMGGYYADMRRVGARSDFWPDAVYELADWLKNVKPSNVVALTFGLSRNLYFLLGGDVYIYDMHSYSGSEFKSQDFTNRVVSFMQDEKTRYLVNVQWCDQRAVELFKKIVNSTGKRLVEDKMFYQRDGKPELVVYSVK
jgi:4-amino-4-deoxy-L-arabinose transferase-like glycosyltransferase